MTEASVAHTIIIFPLIIARLGSSIYSYSTTLAESNDVIKELHSFLDASAAISITEKNTICLSSYVKTVSYINVFLSRLQILAAQEEQTFNDLLYSQA